LLPKAPKGLKRVKWKRSLITHRALVPGRYPRHHRTGIGKIFKIKHLLIDK